MRPVQRRATIVRHRPSLNQLLVGDATVYTKANHTAAGRQEAFQFTAQESGTIHELLLRTAATASPGVTSVVMGVMADSVATPGKPGAVLGQGTFSGEPATSTWISVAGLSIKVIKGRVYWLVYLPIGGALYTLAAVESGGVGEYESKAGGFTAITATTEWEAFGQAPESFQAIGTAEPEAEKPPEEEPPKTGEVTGMMTAVDQNSWGGIYGKVAELVKYTRTSKFAVAEGMFAEIDPWELHIGVILEGTGGSIGGINVTEYVEKAVKWFKKYGKGGTFWVGKPVDLGCRHFEVLNEPWGNWFWSDPTNYTAYAALLKAVYTAFQKEFPAAIRPYVLANWGTPSFGKGVKTAGGYAFCDMVIVHPYGGSSGQNGGAAGDRALVEEAHTQTGKPVCITELGWPAPTSFGSTGDSQAWTEEQQKANIKAFGKWAREKGYVAVFAYYGMVDAAEGGGYGVYYHNLTKKLGATGLKEVAAENPGDGTLA